MPDCYCGFKEEDTRTRKKHNISSEDFYRQFTRGELGDDLDYFEWKALLEGLREWQETVQGLKDLIDAKRSAG